MGLAKMNQMMVKIFDMKVGRVVNRFLNMCTTCRATVENIYNTMDAKLSELLDSDKPCMHCTFIGMGSTPTNIDIRNSLKTRVIVSKEAIYFSGFFISVMHNSAQKNGKAFQKICSFRVEDLVIDLYYWFKKSPKHKKTLKLFFSFYNQDYFSMMKQINTRWLTLELTLERCLLQYASL